MAKLIKATVIDGIAATEDRDSQNEVLSLRGADVNQMTDKGYFNDNHGTGFANTLGRITVAKKVFDQKDANDERMKMYWDRVKRPFLYVKGYLFDEAEHPNAKAVAAIMREFKKMGTPLDVQMSVEGKVVSRGENGLLSESQIRNVALTLVPANHNTGAQIVSEDAKKAILAHCQEIGANVNYADSLMKSLSVCTGTAVSLPGFIEIVDEDPYMKVFDNVKEIKSRVKMLKALMAGYGSAGAPASRVDGAALMSGKKGALKSVTVELSATKRKRQEVLKTLIRKAKGKNPATPYGKLVKAVLKVFHTKLNKGE